VAMTPTPAQPAASPMYRPVSFTPISYTSAPVPRDDIEGFGIAILGFFGAKFRGAYVASKFAVEGMADTLRLELHGSGIHVVLIEPGPIESRFREHALEQIDSGRDREVDGDLVHKSLRLGGSGCTGQFQCGCGMASGAPGVMVSGCAGRGFTSSSSV